MQKIAILIPCYNEEKRLDGLSFEKLLQSTTADIFFVNDGSTDNTLDVVSVLASKSIGRCQVIDYPQNEGKAKAVYKAVNYVLEKNGYDYVGYLDADFSTPVSEVIRIIEELNSRRPSFIFGSRILVLNSVINRKLYRHIIGRTIVTFINLRFRLGIYDTQCGAKFFDTTIAKGAFTDPFVTSWLFDVEIFVRLKRANLLGGGIEFPLRKWTDVEGSKLNFGTSAKILKEIYKLFKTY